MVIDFHAHAFPNKIAQGTIEKLQRVAKIKAGTDGTYMGLQKSMKEAGIRASVVLPVVTKPSQFETVNQFAASHLSMEGIIPFGGIHPDSGDYKGELKRIKELGLKGIKLHPDYQLVPIDDERYVRILRCANELRLWTVIHAGVDIGYPLLVNASPNRVANMLKMVTGEGIENRIILAHTGGFNRWDEVESLLVGKDVYFDTSYTLGFINKEQFIRIIKNHGKERLVFGTDSPWSDQKESIQMFDNLPLNKEEKDAILYKNAVRMLDLKLTQCEVTPA